MFLHFCEKFLYKAANFGATGKKKKKLLQSVWLLENTIRRLSTQLIVMHRLY